MSHDPLSTTSRDAVEAVVPSSFPPPVRVAMFLLAFIAVNMA